jgi:hypothetical protein
MRETSPSPDAGLVMPLHALAQRDLGSILDAKDAEIERLKKAFPFQAWRKQKAEAQAEIERLREALDCVLKYHCPNIQSVAVDRARAALGGKP